MAYDRKNTLGDVFPNVLPNAPRAAATRRLSSPEACFFLVKNGEDSASASARQPARATASTSASVPIPWSSNSSAVARGDAPRAHRSICTK